MSLQLLLWIIAAVLFVVAAFVPAPRYSQLVAGGLAFLTAGFIAGAV